MKKMLFLLLCFFVLFSDANATSYVNTYYALTNKCSVIKDNKIVVPITVKVNSDNAKFSKLMNDNIIGYVDNYRDILKLDIYDVNKESLDVYVDFNRTSEGKSLIYFNSSEDFSLSRHEELVSFYVGVEILDDTKINSFDILGNEVVIADEKTCEMINSFKIKELERIIYVDLSEIDHQKYLEDIFLKVLIVLLTIILLVCIILLIKKKK